MKNKLLSPNEFMILLTAGGFIIALVLMLLNFSQKQDIRGRAYQALGCNNNSDCPNGTNCRGGQCIITSPSITQTPLAYVDVSKIIETPKPIPPVYVSPSPTPEPNFLLETSAKINDTAGSAVTFLLRFLENLTLKGIELFQR